MVDAASLAGVRALTFDVQGTCADFCQPLLRMGEAVNRAKGLSVDWGILSADWRGLYRAVLDEIIAGKRGTNGLWRREAALPGKEFLVMEAPRGPSRWTTLMALRVLKAYGKMD